MKHYYPTYYRAFRCIAAACPDSCCQGWDVVVDSDTEAFYRTVSGSFGERLRGAIETDDDGDRIFTLAEQKKCPFWGRDRLCEIYRELGEEHLCATCKNFPRITMDYTVFTEHSLSLACPEAARLILSADDAYAGFTHTDCAPCEEFDADDMTFFLQTRQKLAALLSADQPLPERLAALRRSARDAQHHLTGEIADPAALSPAVFDDLEYIDEENRLRITQAASREPDFSQAGSGMTNLILYWLYRYLPGAVDALDLIAPIRFLITSAGVVSNLAKESGDLIAAAQTYSKEIEQSYENMERLWQG